MWSKEPLSDLRVYRVQQVLNGPTDHYTLAGIMSSWLRKYFRIITHLTPIPHFYTSWKRQKIFFWPDKATWYVLYEQLFWRTSANEYFYLTFSGSIETEHWREWVSNASIPNPGTCFNVLKSSHRRCPIKKSCSSKFCSIHKKTPALESPAKNRRQHRYIPMSISKFLRTPILKNNWERLVLTVIPLFFMLSQGVRGRKCLPHKHEANSHCWNWWKIFELMRKVKGNAQFVQKVTFETLMDFKPNHYCGLEH